MIHFSQKHVPEYACACCDQLWFKFSVVKCDPNKYKACSPDIVEFCLTDFTSVDDTEWICITCNVRFQKISIPPPPPTDGQWQFLGGGGGGLKGRNFHGVSGLGM